VCCEKTTGVGAADRAEPSCDPLLLSLTQAQSSQGAPVYEITPVKSKIIFHVKASTPIEGTFEKWDATLEFTSTDASTGVLDFKIQAASVNTGSEEWDKRMQGKDCLDVEKDPYITFHSSKIMQTGPHSFDVPGTFTFRGITKAETLNFTTDTEGKGTGEIKGAVVFDRRDFGLRGIRFSVAGIADSVDLTIDFKTTRVSGPPLLFK
jgi:polyisoprenoid-binding protein YceI